jgi:hypothetical protein
MADLNFPTSPTLYQQYTLNGQTFVWDGKRWKFTSSSVVTINAGTAITSINNLITSEQFFNTGDQGSLFNISSSGSTHTFNIPIAGTASTGLVSTVSQSFAGQKTFTSAIIGDLIGTATTAGYAITAVYSNQSGYAITSGTADTSTYAHQAGYAITSGSSSTATTATYAHQSGYATTSGFASTAGLATTASYSHQSGYATTSGLANTSNYSHQSGYAITSGFATTATIAQGVLSSITGQAIDLNIGLISGTALSYNSNLYYNPASGRLAALSYTGSWAGSLITGLYGGTGYNSYTKGDILVGAGSSFIKLNVGTDNYVLTASSSSSTGLTWTTTAATGLTTLNGLSVGIQNLSFGYSGTVPAFSSFGSTHTLNIPLAGSGSTGLVSTQSQSFAGIKTFTNAVSITDNTGSGSYISGALVVSGGVGIGGTLNVQGDLNIQGTFTTINSTTITVADKNIELGVVASPSDLTAQGGGITLRGATDKSINWYSGVGWSSSESWNLASGNTYKINGSIILSATSLGSGVTNSSLTSVGTINTGVWSATAITAFYGGTGLIPSFTVGDILYANTSSTWGRLTANSNSGYVLTSAGSGSTPVYAAPSTLTVGFATTSTYAHQSGYAITSGFAATSNYSNQSGFAITSGSSNTSGFATTANYAYQSGYAITSILATSSYSLFVNSANSNISHSLLFAPISGSSSGSGVSVNSVLNYNPSTNILYTSGMAITATTVSTSTSNGALQVAGGVGISGRLNFNQASFGTTGISTNPTIAMIGTTGDPIYMSVLEDNTISFEGSQGQLFSITPNLSTGYIYSVNDITGIPLLRANANGNVTANEYAGNFGIGLTNPGYKLHVSGSVGFTSNISSTSTTSGTLVVGGGVGIGGSLYVASATAISGVTINNGIITGNLTGTATTSNYSHISGYGITAGLATTSTYSHQSGYAITSGSSGLATTANYSHESGFAITSGSSGLATTATYAHQSGYAVTSGNASFATTATYAYQSGYGLTSGLATTATYAHQSGYAITSGTSGLATTATYAHQSGFATTANYSNQSGYATTSGFANSSTTASIATTAYSVSANAASTNSSHYLIFSSNATGSGVALSTESALVYNPFTDILSVSGLAVTSPTISTSSSSGALIVTGGLGVGSTSYFNTDVNIGNSTRGRLFFSQATLGSAGTTVIPSMAFIGTTNSPITLSVLPDNSLSFDGSSGQLFSINNNLSTGWIFSINDISGLPIFRANADLTVSMGEYGGNTGIGLTNPSYKLHVAGDTNLSSGYVYRINGASVLSSSSLGTGVTNSSLTALGTISTGTWSGSTITSYYGGTGYQTYSTGDLLVGTGSTLTKLSVGSNNFILIADNTVAGGLKWANISGVAITNINGLSVSRQDLAFGYSGSVPAFASSGSTHTLNIPLAGSGSTGLVSTQAQTFAGQKTFTSSIIGDLIGTATTSSFANTATYSHQSGYAITSGASGLATTANYSHQSGYAITSGFATTANYSYQSGFAITSDSSGFATTSSYSYQSGYAITSGTASLASTANYAHQSGYAITSGFATSSTSAFIATTSQNINVVAASTSASHPVLFTAATGTASGAALSTESTFVYNPSTHILSTSGLAITATTASTDSGTGALTVAGGVGISGRLSVDTNSQVFASFGGISNSLSYVQIQNTSSGANAYSQLWIKNNDSLGHVLIGIGSTNATLINGLNGNIPVGYGYIRGGSGLSPVYGTVGGLSVGAGSTLILYTGISSGNRLTLSGTGVSISHSIASTSTSTGALVVTGGVGIGGSIFGGSTISAADNIEIKSGKELRLNNSGNTAYTGFKAGANPSNTTYTFPITFPGSGTSILQSNTSGTLSWIGIVGLATTANYSHQSGYAITSESSITSGFATTANYTHQSGYAITSGSSGLATTATYAHQSGYAITSGSSGFATTSSYAHQSGYAITSGNAAFATTSTYAHQSGYAITSGSSSTSGLATTATYSHQSGYAITSGLATSSTSVFINNATANSNHPIVFTPISGSISGAGLSTNSTVSYNPSANYLYTSGLAITASTASTSVSTGALIVNGGVGISGNLSYNSALIGNTGVASPPTMTFVGANGDPIKLRVLDDSTLAFSGSQGQLFSISPVLNTGYIFSVNDISGVPLLRANADANVTMGEFAGNIGIGLSNPAYKLHVTGSVGFTSSAPSTSSSTGALVVTGGVGIGGSLYVTSATAISGVTINNGIITGNLTGTASTSTYAISSGLATTSTYSHQSGYAITSGSSGLATTATYSHQSGYATTSGLATTANYAHQSGYGITAGFATTANYSHQSGYAITSGSSSTSGLATTATYAHQSGYAITSSSSGFATTANYAYQSGYGLTSGLATTANYSYQSGYAITSGSSSTSGLATTATYSHQSGYAITSGSSGFASTSTYSYQSGYGLTSGFATTANYSHQSGYAITSGSSGLATTATYAHQSGYGITAGFATSSTSASIANTSYSVSVNSASTNASHYLIISPSASGSGVALSTESALVYNPSTDILSVSGLAVTSGTASTSPTTGALIVSGGVGISGRLHVGTAKAPNYFSFAPLASFANSTNGYTFVAVQNLDPQFASWTAYKLFNDLNNYSEIRLTSSNDYFSPNRFEIINNSGDVEYRSGTGRSHYFRIGNFNSSGSSASIMCITGTQVFISPTTASTSTSTGALVVTGGVGIGQTLFTSSSYASSVSGVILNNGAITNTGTITSTGVMSLSNSSTTALSIKDGSNNTKFNVDTVGGIVSVSSSTASTNTTTGALIVTGGVGIGGSLYVNSASSISGVILNSGVITGNLTGTATTATYSHQSGYAITSGSSSTSGLATTATYAHQSGYAITSGSSGLATTATYAHQSGYGLTSGFATTANYSYQSGYGLTSGLATTANYSHQSGYAITSGSSNTSGLATTATYAHQSGYGLTSGFATTASYSYQSGYGITAGSSNTSGYATTSGFATTATYAYTSGYGITSGLATTATYAHQSGFAQTATLASTATTATNATNVILAADTTNATRRLIYSTNGIGSTSLYNTSTLFTNPSASSIGASVFTNTGSVNIRPGIDATNGVSIGNSSGASFVYFDTINGRIGINQPTPLYDLHIVGELSATNKSFVIDHPTKPDMMLRHGSLEGPENGVYVRGKLVKKNIIELPDYWLGLVDEETITVSLTPMGRFSKLYVEKIENYVVYIQDVESNPINCHFVVYGERKDIPKLDVEY